MTHPRAPHPLHRRGNSRLAAILVLLAGSGLVVALLTIAFKPSPPTSPQQTTAESNTADDSDLPPLPDAINLTDNVDGYEFELPTANPLESQLIWIYLPAGNHPPHSLPAVFIAPGGAGPGNTNMLVGKRLSLDDEPEHLPYAQAGIAVIAYSLSGAVPDNADWERSIGSMRQFRDAKGGLDDLRAARRLALARLPAINPAQLYLAGHGSGGTMALYAAANTERFAGCLAYGPIISVTHYVSPGLMTVFEEQSPGTRTFAASVSPANYAASIRAPLFLFHADDDAEIPTAEVDDFAAAVQKLNSHVTLVHVPTGGNYDSMIKEGIPRGIAWIKQQAQASK